ncbi:Protein phosphatase Slingshot [Eumeta japonica]|uniref:Protein phosphatase Slingshot n=1 Tax=Eumeta variegata TaxID=151549 RepID=A0A4C1WD96_EUMVA|nr:Protein phosphatase Slingshot [Eumeta japonica]
MYFCCSLNECYFASKGAALVLAGAERGCAGAGAGAGAGRRRSPTRAHPQPDIQHHLQSMFYLLRPEETLKMHVAIVNVYEATRAHCARALCRPPEIERDSRRPNTIAKRSKPPKADIYSFVSRNATEVSFIDEYLNLVTLKVYIVINYEFRSRSVSGTRRSSWFVGGRGADATDNYLFRAERIIGADTAITR